MGMELELGEKIKTLRKSKQLNIAQLSALSGVSTGLISQIERGIGAPSVTNLYKIANALNTHISFFFDDDKPEDESVFITKAGSHMKMIAGNSASTYMLLCKNNPNRALDMVEVRLKVGAEGLDKQALSHEGEEVGYVLEGTLTVVLNDREYVLEKGDSISFSSTSPHKYVNKGNVECVSIWAMTPKFF